MTKKKILSAVTAIMCCAGMVSAPGMAFSSNAETENRDKVYETSLILDEKIVTTLKSLDACISDNQLIAYTALRDKSIAEVYCDSEEVISVVKEYAAKNGLDESIIMYYVHPYDEWEYDDACETGEETNKNPLVLNENVAHTSTIIDSYIWNNGVKAYTALSNKKVIEVYCHSQEIADQIKNIVFSNGLDASIVEYFIKPMGELNYEGSADDTPVTNDELEELLKITGELNTYLYERGYIEECGYASLRWGKHSVWLAVQSEAIAEELSAYITENEISENLVDIIIAPEYDYRIPDGGQKEPDEVNTIVVDGYFALKDYLISNKILSNIYLTARQNKISPEVYNSIVEITVKTQEDSDAIKKYMLDNYFWDAVVDITVDPDLTKGSDSFFVYSMAHISLNDIIAEENTSPGDINSDGKVDLTDLSELSLAIIGDRTLTEKQIEAADINENGEADLPDLARLKQYLSKVITSLR